MKTMGFLQIKLQKWQLLFLRIAMPMFVIFLTPTRALAIEPECSKIVRVGYIEFPPVFYTNPNGEAEGLLIDLTKKVLSDLGCQYKFISMPAKRMAASLVAGQIDLWVGLPSLPDFGDGTLAGESVVSSIHLRAYRIQPLKDIYKSGDLKGHSVILISGYGYGGLAVEIMKKDSGIKYFIAQDRSQAVSMLNGNRAEYLLDYKEPIDSYFLKKESPKGFGYNDVSEISAKFVVSKKKTNYVEFLNSLEATFKKLKANNKL